MVTGTGKPLPLQASMLIVLIMCRCCELMRAAALSGPEDIYFALATQSLWLLQSAPFLYHDGLRALQKEYDIVTPLWLSIPKTLILHTCKEFLLMREITLHLGPTEEEKKMVVKRELEKYGPQPASRNRS